MPGLQKMKSKILKKEDFIYILVITVQEEYQRLDYLFNTDHILNKQQHVILQINQVTYTYEREDF